MEKKLDIHQPYIDSFNIYGSLFSILNDNEETNNWICNNFIQLRFFQEVVFFEGYRSIFYNCTNTTTNRISRNILKRKWNNNIIEFLEDMIDENYYILMYDDVFYIKRYKSEFHHNHELFVYGYDTERRVLFCADNVIDGKYSTFEAPFDEVELAYWNVEDSSYYTDLNCITTQFGYDVPDKMDLKQIYVLLKDYINSDCTVNFSEHISANIYGFQIHKMILDKYINKEKDADLDIRPVRVFYDHKKLMIFRLEKLSKFLNTNVFDQFINCYKEVEEQYDIISCLVIRYNLIHQESLLSNIYSHFEKAIEMEESNLDQLRSSLESFL